VTVVASGAPVAFVVASVALLVVLMLRDVIWGGRLVHHGVACACRGPDLDRIRVTGLGGLTSPEPGVGAPASPEGTSI
jgi:hypothetical protein